MSKNLSHLSGRKGLTENLFENISRYSEKDGHLSGEDAARIADEFLMGTANVFGTASFYDFTRTENAGKKIYVCNGSACLTAGTQSELRSRIEGHFKSEEIGEMCCLGRCHENAAFHYEGGNYSGSAIDEIEKIVKNHTRIRDKYQVRSKGPVLLTGQETDLQEAQAVLQDCFTKNPEALLAEIKASGLRGRGGAGFPIGIKLEGCLKAPGPRKFIVCNADEGDPGSYSDRYLLEQQPVLLILGMLIAGYVTGADRGVIYIRAEYPESVERINETLLEMRALGFTGERIFGSDFQFEFKVIKAQGAYICGEETALLSSIEGQRPEVRVRPPFPVQEGLFRKPTVVNNVETLANLYSIVKNGGASFSSIGTAKSSGTKLMSLDSYFLKPGIYEVEMGTPLQEVVYQLGGGFRSKVKALHIGGPLGGLVPISKIEELTVDFESFSSSGFMLGHASIVSVPDHYPMIAYLEHLFAFTAHESCGKCFPCRIGSTRGKEMLQKAQKDPDYKIDLDLLNDLLDTMKRGSLCALGGGIPLPVYNALQYFPDELSAYLKK
ncbi:MAG TPA: NADH-ubiquinone oxidoreductase-F iron-sulfur binding region domain-containing protein [Saprospiraceae bacterium]|nr:NADH-ubiquinone oxidoreductase-F iron-sulfur binding region domain-containing protein [Saprospiraceae bacterium]